MTPPLKIENCALCKIATTPNLMVVCILCGETVCFDCTPSPSEMQRLATDHEVSGLWDAELEELDPQGKEEGGGLIGFVCLMCHNTRSVLPAKPVNRELLRSITEQVLTKIYGKKFAPHAKREPVPEAITVGVEEHADLPEGT